ncbi:unnamed protein product, partial [Discosporangium mesarthrocarpum]
MADLIGNFEIEDGVHLEEETSLLLGFDVGGTNVKAGLVCPQTGKLLAKHSTPWPPFPSAKKPEALVELILSLGVKVLDEKGLSWEDVLAIGVACPGHVEREVGVVVSASAFPEWHNVPLASMVYEATLRPTTLLNDASAATSAAYAAREEEESCIVVLTLGTGIGMGLVSDGHVLNGANGLIEGGHMIVDSSPNARLCGCGQRGCLEAYASASAVAKIAMERMSDDSSGHHLGHSGPYPEGGQGSSREGNGAPCAEGCSSPRASTDMHKASPTPGSGSDGVQEQGVRAKVRLMELKCSLTPAEKGEKELNGTGGVACPELPGKPWKPGAAAREGMTTGAAPGGLTTKDVFSMAADGHPVAEAVVSEACDYLGVACINICRMVDPEAILLTGGMSQGKGIVERVRESFLSRGWTILPNKCHIGLAMGTDADTAGVVGAAGAAGCEFAISALQSQSDASWRDSRSPSFEDSPARTSP